MKYFVRLIIFDIRGCRTIFYFTNGIILIQLISYLEEKIKKIAESFLSLIIKDKKVG